MTFEETKATEIITSAPSQRLGVGANITQEEFNRKMVEVLERVESKFEGTGVANNGLSTTAAGVSTTAAKKIAYSPTVNTNLKSIKYGTLIDDYGAIVSWDVTDFLNSLPPGHSIRSVRVYTDGVSTVPFDSKQRVGTATIKMSEFPAILQVEIRTHTDEGVYRFIGGRELTVENKKSSFHMENTNSSVVKTVETQEDLNEYILERLSLIERKVGL